ncbi:hypothetical protein DAEQUDRAFT_807447 [Daedalea quercina L-15889]|uniref:Uncharacterized protein n=1 Tax=Daedalea quercina L-15889 TaxID=1314783 RepID=A0A165U2A4_9APHY|nr:hypothetical protein DAEQUDRAFT_807447 [Daedalea quercina L-15889]
MPFPNKRALTEEQRVNEPPLANNGVDAELAARLRNMASRVRKSVTEGYAPSAPGAPNIPRITSKLPFTRSASFQSANDALREVYASHSGGFPSSSDAKRKLGMEEAEGDVMEDDDIDLEDETTDLRIPLTSQFSANNSMRPIKSLPHARRGGIRSISDSTVVYGGRSDSALVAAETTIEEEDWSQGSFAPVVTEPPH